MATEVASLYAKIGADLSDFHRGMSQFGASVNSAGGMFRNFTTGIVQGIGQAFGYASIQAIRGFGDAITGTIAAAAGMEQGIADISAVMGLTGDETAKVSKLISDLGIDPKLKVTATEAANAVEMLGKSGLSLDQILGGAARSTVLLANSTGSDFATAADIATSAMAQFKIDAKDMAGAVDQITGVTRNSKFDINDYRLAIAQAGGVAASVGVEFDDFNATVAAIAPLFASGSDAGTSFKTFLQRLAPDTKPAIDAMTQLGIITADGQNKFFDASGQMRSMADIAGVLQESFAGLTEEQKISAATIIFGTDSMRAAFALADAGSGTINKLKGAIGDTSAEESAAIRMNTLSGLWEIFQGIVESLSIQFGTAFLPSARDVVAVLTEMATRIGPQVVAWGQQLGERFKVVTGAAVELINLGLAEGFTAIFTPLQDGSRHLDKLFEAFGMTKEQAAAASQQFIDTSTTIKDMALAVVALIKAVGDIVGPLVTFTNNTIGLENALKAVGVVMAASFAASIVSTITTIVSAVGSVATFVASLTGLGSVATAIGSAVVAAISAIGGPITLIVAAIGALALAWSQNWWDIQGKTKAAWEAIQSYSSAGWEAVKGFFGGGWDYLKQVTGDGWEWTKRAFADGWEATKRNTTSGWDATKQAFASGWEWTKRTTTDGWEYVKRVTAEGWEYTKRGSNDGWSATKGFFTGGWDYLKKLSADGWTMIRGAFTSGWDAVRNATVSAWEAIKRAVTDAWGAVVNFVRDGVNNIKSFFTGGWFEIGQNMARGIVDGIRSGWNWVTDAAKGVAQAAVDTAKGTLGVQSPSKVFKEVGHNVGRGFALGIDESVKMPKLSVGRMSKQTVQAVAPAAAGGGPAMAGGSRRLDIYLHGESALPNDRIKLRELARALQQELILSGGRVAVA